MGQTVGVLDIQLAADIAKFSAGLKEANAKLDGFNRETTKALGSIERRFAGMAGNVGGALAGLAAGFTITGIALFTKNALDAAGGLGELASQAGVSTTALQSYQYAASQAGMTAEEMQTALTKLTKSIGDAVDGEKAAIEGFRAMGVSILDAQGKTRSTEAVLKDIADAYQRSGDKAKAAADLTELFGRSGQKLIPVLSQGAQGLSDFEQAAIRAGVVLDEKAIKQADEAADKIAELTLEFQKLSQSLIVKVAPGLKTVMEMIQAVKNGDWGKLFELTPEQKETINRLRELRGDPSRVGDSNTISAPMPPPLVKPAPEGAPRLPQSKSEIEEAERAAEKIAKVTEALRLERDAYDQTAAQIATYTKLREAGIETADLVVNAEGQVIGAVDEQAQRIADLVFAINDLKFAREAETAASEDGVSALSEYIDGLEDQLRLLGMSELARKQHVAVMQAEALAMREGNLLSDENKAKIQGLVAAYEEHTAATQELQSFGERAFDRIGDSMTRMAMEGGNAFDSLRNIGQAVISELMQEFVKLAAINPIKNALFGSSLTTLSSLGGLFGGIGGAGGGAAYATADYGSAVGLAPSFGTDITVPVQGFAEGGRPPLGKLSIVGEKGPELFVPDSAGTIIPNDMLGGGGNTYVIDARGADVGAVSRLEQALLHLAGPGKVEQRAISAVSDAQARNRMPR
jgi:hypothetical protein